MVTDPADLEVHRDAWDKLADAAGLPLATSGWVLALHRAAQAMEPLRVVLCFKGERLVGVGPFSIAGRDGPLGYAEARLMGAGNAHRIAPIVEGDAEGVVALMAETLAGTGVDALALEGLPADADWPARLARAWPTRRTPQVQHAMTMPAPSLGLEEGYDAWLARRSPRFRKAIRASANATRRRGGAVRHVEDPAELPGVMDALFRLHRARFVQLGIETALGPSLERSVREAAPALLASGRLVLFVVEAAEGIVGVELALRTGRVLTFWNGGYDGGWAKESLGLVLMHEVVRYGARTGVVHMDLGGGDQPYKLRFADDDAPVLWASLYPWGPRWGLVRAHLGPKHARQWVRTRLRPLVQRHPEAVRRLRRLLRLGRG